MMAEKVRLANEEADFSKVGLDKYHVAEKEDGLRTQPEGENYEWWYFDANLNDGSQIVTTFYAKSVVNPSGPLQPKIDVEWTKADGTSIKDTLEFDPSEFSASKDKCNVKIGKNYFRGDLHHYEIGIFSDKLNVAITYDNVTPAWRPNLTIYFGNDEDKNFSWLPATPRGHANVEIEVDGETKTLNGNCYHDHNWGNVALMKVMHHWYWGRANIGDYTVISSYMTAEKKYGYSKIPIFLVAKDDQILAENTDYVTYSETNRGVDEFTNKPFYKELTYDYNDGKNHYQVIYSAERVITHEKMIDQIAGIKKWLAKLAGFDGAYLRFSGKVTLEIIDQDGKVSESYDSKGLWEQVYFGKTLNV